MDKRYVEDGAGLTVEPGPVPDFLRIPGLHANLLANGDVKIRYPGETESFVLLNRRRPKARRG